VSPRKRCDTQFIARPLTETTRVNGGDIMTIARGVVAAAVVPVCRNPRSRRFGAQALCRHPHQPTTGPQSSNPFSLVCQHDPHRQPRQHFLEQAITSQISISSPRKSRQAGRPVLSNRTTRPATHMPPDPTHPGGSTTKQHEVLHLRT